MFLPLKISKKVKLKNPPWFQIQFVDSNRLLLIDDNNFAIFDHKNGKINCNCPEAENIIAVFLSKTEQEHLVILYEEVIEVIDIVNQEFVKSFDNLPNCLKFKKEKNHQPPKFKNLFGIQKNVQHDFDTKSKLGLDFIEYSNGSLIVSIGPELLVFDNDKWYSYELPIGTFSHRAFYDFKSQNWNIYTNL